jgi:hypothetical protein
MHRGDKECINILIGKPEGKRPLGKLQRLWEDNKASFVDSAL